jgi:hypothetical protein
MKSFPDILKEKRAYYGNTEAAIELAAEEYKNQFNMTEEECHDLYELKEAVRSVLYMTIAGGNGGYSSQFGPVTFSKMVRLTDFDIKKRRILEKSDWIFYAERLPAKAGWYETQNSGLEKNKYYFGGKKQQNRWYKDIKCTELVQDFISYWR